MMIIMMMTMMLIIVVIVIEMMIKMKGPTEKQNQNERNIIMSTHLPR